MSQISQTDSRRLLARLRETLAEDGDGQARLNQVTCLIAQELGAEVCSVYLFCDENTLELCASEGLNPEAVHKTRLRLSEGLVGWVARRRRLLNTANAPQTPGFRYMEETGEEIYRSFLGLPIQRLGEMLGVLVVQTKEARTFSEFEIDTLEIVAMVLAEMAELGAFVAETAPFMRPHSRAVSIKGTVAQEGFVRGQVLLHEPRVVITNPIGEDPKAEGERLETAIEQLRVSVDEMLDWARDKDSEQLSVLEAYRMFANSKGWRRRMNKSIEDGLSAEAAVEKEQSIARSRLSNVPDPYLRERLHDLNDLSNRLLRILTGQGREMGTELPEDPVLVARNIGPAELMDYGGKLRGIVLEEGSVGSHATIIARAWSIPLIIQTKTVLNEALSGDRILVDGEQGLVHLRPEETIARAFEDKISMQAAVQERYRSISDRPARSKCGKRVHLYMNAGLMADLPSLEESGAEGVGLFRTELQFLIQNHMPKREALVSLYQRVMTAAGDKQVIFRTLDIGSDKVLPYMRSVDEPNPALGWRAIRIGLDKRGVMRMQVQALIRAAAGRPLRIMFPFVAHYSEFQAARDEVMRTLKGEERLGHALPEPLEIGAMLETPSLAYAPEAFFRAADFISIGGNDLKQFFFAADRENERVRKRYDVLDTGYLDFLRWIVARADSAGTPISFCGEDAGRPIEALCLAAIGLRRLSMRSASIGRVKATICAHDLDRVAALIEKAKTTEGGSARQAVQKLVMG